MEKMVAEHTGLVKSVALRLSYVYGEDAEDLMQIGYIGLIKAIKGFDPAKGFKFSTYAVPMIAGEIRCQIRDQGRIKISRSLKSDIYAVKKAQDEFLKSHDRSPRISELAQLSEMTEERVVEALQAGDAMKNMEDYEKVSLMTREEDDNVARMDLQEALSKLKQDERKIMMLRYYKDMTQSQVAKAMGMSQVQVCRIEKKILKNMAENMAQYTDKNTI